MSSNSSNLSEPSSVDGARLMLSLKNHDSEKLKKMEIQNIINNPLYLKRMASLIQEFMEKKYDIMQLANGDFIVAETKVINYHYVWNNDKGRFERVKSGSRAYKIKKSTKNRRSNARRAKGIDEDEDENEEEYEDEDEDSDDIRIDNSNNYKMYDEITEKKGSNDVDELV